MHNFADLFIKLYNENNEEVLLNNDDKHRLNELLTNFIRNNVGYQINEQYDISFLMYYFITFHRHIKSIDTLIEDVQNYIYHFHKKFKIAVTAIIYFAMILTELRFGLDVFLPCFYEKLIYTAAFIMVAILCYIYFSQIISEQPKRYINVADLNLSNKHIKVFYLITQNIKFETIATKLNYSVPSVKRIARNIYKELEVPDLICFNAKIGRYKIIYPEDFIPPEI